MIWNSDLAEAMEYDNLLSQAMVTMFGAAIAITTARARLSFVVTHLPFITKLWLEKCL
jgi:hypothetical protein